jgi:hypothetical protein
MGKRAFASWLLIDKYLAGIVGGAKMLMHLIKGFLPSTRQI